MEVILANLDDSSMLSLLRPPFAATFAAGAAGGQDPAAGGGSNWFCRISGRQSTSSLGCRHLAP